MTLHFENIWEEAEKIYSKEELQAFSEHISAIKRNLDFWSETDNIVFQTKILGNILYELCCLTHKNNLDSAVALKTVIEEHKQQLLDPDDV